MKRIDFSAKKTPVKIIANAERMLELTRLANDHFAEEGLTICFTEVRSKGRPMGLVPQISDPSGNTWRSSRVRVNYASDGNTDRWLSDLDTKVRRLMSEGQKTTPEMLSLGRHLEQYGYTVRYHGSCISVEQGTVKATLGRDDAGFTISKGRGDTDELANLIRTILEMQIG